MKAYRDADGGVRLFRPELNIRRFNRSMGRLCFPEVDESSMVELIRYFHEHVGGRESVGLGRAVGGRERVLCVLFLILDVFF